MGGTGERRVDRPGEVVAPLVASDRVLVAIDAGDRWGRAVRAGLEELVPLTSGVGELLDHWRRATGTRPTRAWLRVEDELRERLGGEVDVVAHLLLEIFLETSLPTNEYEAVKARNAAAYDLLRTIRVEQRARQAGELRYLGRADDGPVAAWAASVNPRLEALPSAIRHGELFGPGNADLLRGVVWSFAHAPADAAATASLLAAVAEHGVDTNRGLEPGTEAMVAGKAVNACFAMLAM